MPCAEGHDGPRDTGDINLAGISGQEHDRAGRETSIAAPGTAAYSMT